MNNRAMSYIWNFCPYPCFCKEGFPIM